MAILETEQLPKPEILTPEEKSLRNLFLLSYQYSQGTPALQEDLFTWSAAKGFIPKDIEITDDIPSYILTIKPPSRHKDVDFVSISTDLIDMWIKMLNATRPEIADIFDSNKMMLEYTYFTIRKDLLYQGNTREGRPEMESCIPDSNFDPHKSFLRKYAILGEETGHPAYNLLFQEIGEKVKETRKKDSSLIMRFAKSSRKMIEPEPFQAHKIPRSRNIYASLQELELKWNFNHVSSGETFFPIS